MNSVSIQQFLRRRTAETLIRLVEARHRETERRDKAPQPGDLFVFPATADFEVQWAVLDQHPERRGVFLVVPADLNPQVGSTDVAVPAMTSSGAVASSGALTLRCRFGVWLPAVAFEVEMRGGCVPFESLELARHKRAEVARGLGPGSALERETDTEPDYQDWMEEVLAPAQAMLIGLGE